MSETLSRIKLQLRPVNGSVLNGNGNGSGSGDDKTPTSPATKLLINHGKPNYTIQRSPNAERNGATSPFNDELQNNNRNNYYPYKSASFKGTTTTVTNVATNNNTSNNTGSQNGDDLIIQSTKFNGVFKPANIQGLETRGEVENQVTLRRVPKPESLPAQGNSSDDNVPEFILRQRRIQERLSKENVLDFENRRSGYFTHVVFSPTSPNRTSLVETMSSPPIVPSLEIPPPVKEARESTIVEENSVEVSTANVEAQAHEESHAAISNGHVEEEEVARAIEEVNKAVAGEVDDEKADVAEDEKPIEVEKVAELAGEHVEVAAAAELKEEEQLIVDQTVEEHTVEDHTVEEPKVEETQIPNVSVVVTSAPLVEVEATHVEAVESNTEPAVTIAAHVEAIVEQPEPQQPAVEEQPKENGHADVEEVPQTNGHVAEEVTISHTNGMANGVSNGLATPSLPKPDPSGALGVNYEPKTVVSFSKDLGEPNKYPDTVVKTAGDGASDELKELAKLKFDIKADDNDVQVTSVLRTE